MGYKISYMPENSDRYPQVTRRWHVRWKKVCIWILVLTAAFWLKVNGVPDFLIPGDPKVTKLAVNIMLTEMRKGEPVEEVVVAFCESILNGESN